MEFDPVLFGRRLRHYRRRQGLTLDQLGAAIGRPAPYLSLVENGKREPRLSQITALASALGVAVSDLLEPEPPNRRARLEVALERAQQHPRYVELGLPYLKATARLPDEALEHIVALFEQVVGDGGPGASPAAELRRANGALTAWLRERDGYLPEVEEAAAAALATCRYEGPGPLTSRHLADLARSFGFRIRAVEEIPATVRAIVDRRSATIYVAQRNELRTRQARKAVLQTLGTFALAHSEPRSAFDLLRTRLETAYFAAAVLVPEPTALPFLRHARHARDLSVEDLKEQFYVSYEMAAQRFTNLATRHLEVRTHFLRSDEHGIVWKAYADDGLPLPADHDGGSEGQRLCREWSPRAAYRAEDRFDVHYQYTDTPAGSFWCATHVAPDLAGHAFTSGVRFEDARFFRGRQTSHRLVSRCPDGECCRRAPAGLAERWSGRGEAFPRLQQRLVGLLSADLAVSLEPAELYGFLDRQETPFPSEGPGVA